MNRGDGHQRLGTRPPNSQAHSNWHRLESPFRGHARGDADKHQATTFRLLGSGAPNNETYLKRGNDWYAKPITNSPSSRKSWRARAPGWRAPGELAGKCAQGNLQEIDGAPQSAHGKDDGDSRFEESPVDEISQRLLVDVLFFLGLRISAFNSRTSASTSTLWTAAKNSSASVGPCPPPHPFSPIYQKRAAPWGKL